MISSIGFCIVSIGGMPWANVVIPTNIRTSDSAIHFVVIESSGCFIAGGGLFNSAKHIFADQFFQVKGGLGFGYQVPGFKNLIGSARRELDILVSD